jgi:energy-coupling factor transporter transmembrane protein EcfT|uniref:PH domain-containing protein n=1 Tax=candidate division WOR-3 bacterium TaxID=2052148 RepID=A0A7V3VU58_UNCW3
MRWQVHPAKENPAKTLLSGTFIVVFLILIALVYNLYWALLGFIFLISSLHSYYFPTTYEITEDELIIKTVFSKQRRKLNEFKKFYIGKNGILLSPFIRRTFLNNFRGVFLLLPKERDEIVKFIKDKFKEKNE